MALLHSTGKFRMVYIDIATVNSCFSSFWAYVVPLLYVHSVPPISSIHIPCYIRGAYIADAHWGRYKTIFWAIMIALVGHIILIVSAVPGVIEKTEGATACFVIGMIVTGFGELSFKGRVVCC